MKETCDGDLARFFIYLFLILFFELVVRAVDVGGAPGITIQCFQESFYDSIRRGIKSRGIWRLLV